MNTSLKTVNEKCAEIMALDILEHYKVVFTYLLRHSCIFGRNVKVHVMSIVSDNRTEKALPLANKLLREIGEFTCKKNENETEDIFIFTIQRFQNNPVHQLETNLEQMRIEADGVKKGSVEKVPVGQWEE